MSFNQRSNYNLMIIEMKERKNEKNLKEKF